MPKHPKKDVDSAPTPRPLPMPRYDYQSPRTGTLVIPYEDESKREQSDEGKAPCLQNLRLLAT